MARIPYFDMSQASEKYQALLKSRNPLNLYRMLPHAGEAAASGFLAMGSALLRDNELDSQLREIAILRALCDEGTLVAAARKHVELL